MTKSTALTCVVSLRNDVTYTSLRIDRNIDTLPILWGGQEKNSARLPYLNFQKTFCDLRYLGQSGFDWDREKANQSSGLVASGRVRDNLKGD